MARSTAALTATQIKQAKSKDKDYKLSDGGGLFLLVTKRDSKLWRLKYKYDRKEKLLSLESYPSISLSKARELREKHKTDIANGINPSTEKQEIKAKQKQKIKIIDTMQDKGIFESTKKTINLIF